MITNPNQFTVTISPGRRWLRTGLFLLVIVIALWSLYARRDHLNSPVILANIALIVLAVVVGLQVWRYRLTLTENSIETRGLFTTQMLWSEILQAKERKRHLVLYGPTKTVRIPPDVDQFDEVVRRVSGKLNALPVFRHSGVSGMWQLAPRDDEGRRRG